MLDWAIGTGIAVSLLILLVLIMRRPFARMFGARAAYALWLLPFIRLVMPEVTIPRIFPQLATNPAPEIAGPSEIMLTPEMLAALQAEPSLMSQLEPYFIPAALVIWAVGAMAFFLYHWASQASLMDRLTYASEPASAMRNEITSAAQAAGLRRTPQVRISDEKAGPLVAGILRPIVILPDNFMTAFSPQQRHYALMHEFMHVKRGDVGVALAWLAFRAVNWPNPLVHFAAKHFRIDQEAACDASVLAVMGDTKDAAAGYAETLIHAAKAAIIDGRASPQPSQLALTIHHPLKERLMILGTHRKISNWRSRTAAAVMIIGAATLSAPLIQADAHPEKEWEEELAGKPETNTSKSVIKRMIEVDGKKSSVSFEVIVEGDEVKAFRVDPSGKKSRVDIKDVDGGIFSFDSSGDYSGEKHHLLKLGKGKNSFFFAPSENSEGGVEILSDEITVFNAPHPPTPPRFPKFTQQSENVFVFESDDLESLKSLELLQGLEGLVGLEKLKALSELKGLEGLKGLDGLKGLEALKNLENFEIRSFAMDSPENEVKLKLRMTESKLAAARAMLENTDVDANASREMAKAKRELEKARKALKAAEQALKDAE